MQEQDLVEYLIQTPAARKEIWSYAVNRGLGEGMLIERWLLIEMAARLMELKAKGFVQNAEGEHKFPRAKQRIFEHCDLWWISGQMEHWLEVKTIVVGNRKSLGTIKDIEADVAKRTRMRETDIFHHIAVIFPLTLPSLNQWRNSLDPVYKTAAMSFNKQWIFPLWDDRHLAMFLYDQT